MCLSESERERERKRERETCMLVPVETRRVLDSLKLKLGVIVNYHEADGTELEPVEEQEVLLTLKHFPSPSKKLFNT